MQSHPYGAHEVIELHEVLNSAVDAIHTAQLYIPFVRDPELAQIAHHQLQFMQGEYNGLVYTVQGLGAGELLPYRPIRAFSPADVMAPQPAQMSEPHHHAARIDDRDAASALLGIHKAGAKLKMAAALEAAHPQIRDLLLQGAVNCAHQAHELWAYMQRKGYYKWAVMPEAADAQLLRGYQPVRPEADSAERPASMAPSQTINEQGSISAPLQKESANGVRVAPLVDQPLTPVNASPASPLPPYRQDHGKITEDTAMTTDVPQTQGIEPSDGLYQQADVRQTKSRKKNTVSDSYLGQ